MAGPARETLGIAVFGAGYWARNMLRAITAHPGSELLYICDPSEQARKSISVSYPLTTVIESPEAALADPRVDAVYIASPPATHYELAIQALNANKHALVEKPMTTDSATALDLVKTAANNRLTLMVGHTFLYSPPVRKVREIIELGTLGPISYIDSQRVNLTPHQTVGVVWDLAPHDISIANYWVDAMPVRVRSAARTMRTESEGDDFAFVTLEYPDGALAQIHVSWLAPTKLRRTTVSGASSMLVYDDTAGEEAVKVYTKPTVESERRRTPVAVWSPSVENAEPLRTEWDHFINSIRSHSTPITSGVHGLHMVDILTSAQHSLQTGSWEEIHYTAAD